MRIRQRAFACNELPIAMIVLWVAIGAGLGVSKWMGLGGTAALAPPTALVACLLLLIIGINAVDGVRRRSREQDPKSPATAEPPADDQVL